MWRRLGIVGQPCNTKKHVRATPTTTGPLGMGFRAAIIGRSTAIQPLSLRNNWLKLKASGKIYGHFKGI
jgi:hypothetical protein